MPLRDNAVTTPIMRTATKINQTKTAQVVYLPLTPHGSGSGVLVQ